MGHGIKSVGVEGKEKRDEKEDDKVYERQKHEEEEMEKIKKIKQEAWQYINKYRRSREGIDEDISEEEWKNHFMEILEGTEHKEGRKLGAGGTERKRK